MPSDQVSSSGNSQTDGTHRENEVNATNSRPGRPELLPNPTLINFTSTTESHSMLRLSHYNHASLQNHGSPNFSFDSDSPGALAIAEDDEDINDEVSTDQPAQQANVEQPTESAQTGAEMEQAPPVGSVDSAESAERDGFEVVRIRDLALDEADRQQAGVSNGHVAEERPEIVPIDISSRSSSDSPGALQIIDDPTIMETSKEEAIRNAVLANTTGGEHSQNVFGELNPFLAQHRPNDEVMQLLNEQSVRELREKLEIEQQRQQAAENSKLAVNALFSLNAATAANEAAASMDEDSTSNVFTSSSIINGTAKIGGDSGHTPKRREAYRWASNLPIFAMAWSYKRYPNQRLRLACSSIRDGHELLKNTMSIVEFDEEHGELTERTQVFIGAPSCELKFIPTTDASQPDLIASATRELRIYSYHMEQQEVILEAKLCPNKSYAYAGPLTSVDWNETDPRIVGGSSIDSTCTIWDIEAQESIATIPPPAFPIDQHRLKYKIQTQLIAHERPVHGMAFSRLGSGRDYFASCSADGSVRLFDLRNLKNSTILYEHPDKTKLNHISWNKMEPAQFVIVADSSNELVICDVRMPCRPLVKYSKHLKSVNSVDWAPHSPTHFCSGSSDHQALIWQLQGVSDEPLLAYRSEGEITRIRWSSTYNNWIGISFANCLEILRV